MIKMNIEVGEYIRSVDGFIRKVTRVNEKGTYEGLCYGAYSLDVSYKNSVGISSKKVKSHSKNIIDLIEVGDIIDYFSNNLGRNVRIEVNCINTEEEDYKWGRGFVTTTLDEYIYIEDIKLIVTKEQFEGVKYEIK